MDEKREALIASGVFYSFYSEAFVGVETNDKDYLVWKDGDEWACFKVGRAGNVESERNGCASPENEKAWNLPSYTIEATYSDLPTRACGCCEEPILALSDDYLCFRCRND